MTLPANPQKPVKMSALARLSGVPAATIKHYLREGLLPQPELKTGRNMAFYDPALAGRIRQIKTLQREHFLPLRVIKSVLSDGPSARDDVHARAAIAQTLASMASSETRTRAELLGAGAKPDDLAFFEAVGLISGAKVGDDVVYGGEDLALLRVLADSRRAGITPEMLPPEIVAPYVRAIQELVKVELEMFRLGVVPRAGDRLGEVTEAATRLSERLVVLVRRKMLLPMLQALVEAELVDGARRGPSAPSRRARGARPSKPPVRRTERKTSR